MYFLDRSVLKDYHQEESCLATEGRTERKREGDCEGKNWGSSTQSTRAGKQGTSGGWMGSTDMNKEEPVLENAFSWSGLVQIQ